MVRLTEAECGVAKPVKQLRAVRLNDCKPGDTGIAHGFGHVAMPAGLNEAFYGAVRLSTS